MNPLKIKHWTNVLGAPKNWDEAAMGPCEELHVCLVAYEGGQTRAFSAWQPTPEELAAMSAGAPLILSVVGGQPPVALFIGDPSDVV